MRRFVLGAVLLASTALPMRAAVVELAPVRATVPGSPVPSLSPTAFTATLTPTLAPALSLSAPDLGRATPALLPVTAAPIADGKTGVTPAAARTPIAASVRGDAPHERGPPTARDGNFSSYVSRTVADTVRAWSVPSEEILETHDAILVGENHRSLASVTELSKALPGLAKAGVRVLGIEGLKRPNQSSVDAYVSGRADALPAEVLAFSPQRRSAFETLLKTARDNGVRVVALGVPLDEWSRQAAELAAKKTGDPLETFLRSPGEQLYRAQVGYEPGYNEAVAEVYLTRRNRSMAAFLVESMVQGVNAVVLVGQNHVEGADPVTLKFTGERDRWGTMGRELARLGLRAFSLTLTGGLYIDVDSARDDRDARPGSHALAARVSPSGAPAFERTGEDTGLYHAGGTVPGATVAH